MGVKIPAVKERSQDRSELCLNQEVKVFDHDGVDAGHPGDSNKTLSCRVNER